MAQFVTRTYSSLEAWLQVRDYNTSYLPTMLAACCAPLEGQSFVHSSTSPVMSHYPNNYQREKEVTVCGRYKARFTICHIVPSRLVALPNHEDGINLRGTMRYSTGRWGNATYRELSLKHFISVSQNTKSLPWVPFKTLLTLNYRWRVSHYLAA